MMIMKMIMRMMMKMIMRMMMLMIVMMLLKGDHHHWVWPADTSLDHGQGHYDIHLRHHIAVIILSSSYCHHHISVIILSSSSSSTRTLSSSSLSSQFVGYSQHRQCVHTFGNLFISRFHVYHFMYFDISHAFTSRRSACCTHWLGSHSPSSSFPLSLIASCCR